MPKRKTIDESAFPALALLVAVCDQALDDLEDADPWAASLLTQIQITRDVAADAASRMADAV
jgi:hypothetical protein